MIYSKESNHSEQVKSELAVAEDCDCKIFTFRISDEKMNPSFTYSLKKLHWIDAINVPLQNSIKELRERVCVSLDREESAAQIEELPKTRTPQNAAKAQKEKKTQTSVKTKEEKKQKKNPKM